ncbi:MAG: bifunctional 5,10-methylenetetrahydrofolate dehydrogenase/5,10-methenyltetrahydrofolate cyclohydrolase [Candidatus Altiarchaeota archaeon]
MGVVLDGRAVSAKIKADVKLRAASLGLKPGLATVLVGDDPASKLYVDMKEKACSEVGFFSLRREFPSSIQEHELLVELEKLNADDRIHGILVQLPLPKHMNTNKVLASVSKDKDVDGFHPYNLGRLITGVEYLVASTPKGVIRLLEEYEIPIKGAEVVIVNRSIVVGKPLAMLFLNRHATVTLCHTKTRDMMFHTKRADILVSAVGVPGFIKADMVKKDAVVIDVGTSKKDGKLSGDVDFEGVKKKASHITPVPGGIGPMTIAMLLENTLIAAENSRF